MSKNRKASRILRLWSKHQFFDFLTKYYKWSVRDVLPLLFTQILKIWYFPNCSKEKKHIVVKSRSESTKIGQNQPFLDLNATLQISMQKITWRSFRHKNWSNHCSSKTFRTEPLKKKQLSSRKVNIFLGNVSKSLPPVLENSGQLCFFSDFRNVRNPKNALFWTGPLSGQKRKRQLIINAKG